MTNHLKKSGFVVLAGRSNVGKSTLLNELIGTKVAIVTPKPQTTRLPVRGILNHERGQIVFVDTPGIFLGKKDTLSQRLNHIIREQLEGIDAIVYVVDPTREPCDEEEWIQNLLRRLTIPIIVAINKSDLPESKRRFQEASKKIDVGQKKIVEISALKHHELEPLVDSLLDLLPNGEPFYPPEQLTDLSHRRWLEELIREKIFLHLEEELPYSVHIEVTDLEIRPNGSRFIAATVWTTEERYKRMIIGAKAQMLRQIGQAVREELEAVSPDKVYLELTVKVDAKWQQHFAQPLRSPSFI